MKLKKKFIAGALAAGLVMGAGGIAAAYFTTTGSGSGSGTVGTPTTVTLSGSVSLSEANPGTAETVTIDVTNPNTGNVTLGTVTISNVHAVNTADCPAASFTVTQPTEALGSVPTGTSSHTTAAKTGKITLVTLPNATQSTCNAGVAFTLSVSA